MTQEMFIEMLKTNVENFNLEIFENYKFITYTVTRLDKKYPALVVFKGRQKNPISRYRYPSQDDLIKTLNGYKLSAMNKKDQKSLDQIKKDKYKIEADEKFKVGTILHGSWGYEQTNCEYWQIIEKKGVTVIMESMRNCMIENTIGRDCADMIPGELTGKCLKKRISITPHGAYIKLENYCYLDVWDGKPKYDSWYN